MSFHLHTSNQLERLADRLAALMVLAPASPFVPEPVVVHHLGLGQWLRVELARRLGACIQVDFPLPRAFVDQLVSRLVDGDDQRPISVSFDRPTIEWHLYRLLGELPSTDDWNFPRRYLSDSDPAKRADLAAELANLFDQYLVYRPDWIADWSSGGGCHWQSQLWRNLQARVGAIPPSEKRAAALQALRSGRTPFPPNRTPPRVVLFGVSSLPPTYMEVMAELSLSTEVHVFVLQPCAEWWGDIVTGRELRRELHRLRRSFHDAEALHLEIGQPLLSAWGEQGRDFLRLWQEQTDLEEYADFGDPGQSSLLSLVQRDLLSLFDPPAKTPPDDRREVLFQDDSLLVHSCHSPLRELEVLQDRLLDWFQRDPGLAPRDIVVMAPDLSVYAPLIPAVFETPESFDRRLPYSLADRRTVEGSGLFAAFHRLLRLVGSRMEKDAVLALLECPPLRFSAGIEERDLPTISHWVDRLFVEFGRDAAHLLQLNLSSLGARTWRQAMDRLLLGFAVPDGDALLWTSPNGDEIAPFPGLDGEASELAGRWVEFATMVGSTLAEWETPHTPTQWVSVFQTAFTQFFSALSDLASDLAELRQTISNWGNYLAAAGDAERLPFHAIQSSLLREIEVDRSGVGFLTGGITFCELKPLRCLPFQAICILGLNDGAFPRSPAPPSFDLMGHQPRFGDRSARSDDRYLFLETLISARRWLHLSYLGQSEADSSSLPPSPVIRQLTDYLDSAFRCLPSKEGTEPKNPWMVAHRLHGFSAEYFSIAARQGQSRTFSFSSVQAQAAQVSASSRFASHPFLDDETRLDLISNRTIAVGDLGRFFQHPARSFLRRHLRVELHDPFLRQEDPLGPDLTKPKDPRLIDRITSLLLANRDARRLAPLLVAEGLLPPGTPGAWILEQLIPQAEEYLEELRPFLEYGTAARRLLFQFPVAERICEGHIDFFSNGTVLQRLPRKPKGKDFLRFWIPWLTASAAAVEGPRQGILASPDGIWAFQPVPDSRIHFLELLHLYDIGQQYPLRFFPRASWDWWSAFSGNEDRRSKAQEAAQNTWNGNDFGWISPEKEDPALHILFGHEEDPLNDQFESLAIRIFSPMASVLKKV